MMKLHGQIDLKNGFKDDPVLLLAHSELGKLLARGGDGAEEGVLTVRLEQNAALTSYQVGCDGRALIFSAPSALGVLYGVYDFAERYLGYCFFEPGVDSWTPEERVDAVEEGVLIPDFTPLLKRRGLIQEFPFNQETPILLDWMAKNQLNYLLVWMSYYDQLSDEMKAMAHLRGIEIESGHHNFNYWIPGNVYGQNHPDFFAEVDGKRISPSINNSTLLLSEQLCTTNPALRAEIIKNMVEYCRKHLEITTISLIPNDGFGWCECDQCRKFYDKNDMGEAYSVSAHVYKADRIYHDLLREVAHELHLQLPEITLTFCAYVNYSAPAAGFKLEKKMTVHMAPYWRCINHPIFEESCPVNSHYKEDILAWTRAKNGGEVNIYEYFMGVNFYLSLPMIHFHELFAEMNWYARHQVDGILTQFHIGHWLVYGGNYYLMAKAALGRDETTSIDLMLRRRYASRAPLAKKFYQSLKNLTLKAGDCLIPYPFSLLSRTVATDYQELSRLAATLGDAALIIYCEYLEKYKSLFDRYHRKKLTVEEIQSFLDWVHSHANTRLFVQEKFDRYFSAWIEAIENNTPYYHFNIPWEDRYIQQHAVSKNLGMAR